MEERGMEERDAQLDPGRMPAARRCTVLSFEVESPGVSLRSRKAIITLGGEDGTIDRVVIHARDGIRLVERLAFAFREDERGPSIPYGSRAWFSRNSILRAQNKAGDDLERVYDQTRRAVPNVIEFMNAELIALKRLISRRGRSAARPETVVGRVRKAMIVLVDAMRLDT